MSRYATIDVGTNSVLLLVAERGTEGTLTPVLERAEITRLGRGVDQSRTLAPEAIEETVRCVADFVTQARQSGAADVAVTATSAARDAANAADLVQAVREQAGVDLEIISGEREAQLSFAAVRAGLGRAASGPVVVLDIGGGSTELIYGRRRGAEIDFRHSFEVGSVRLTERFITAHPVPPTERDAIRRHLEQTFSAPPQPPEGFTLVGVAGTVTTLYCLMNGIDPYDPARVEGGRIERRELTSMAERLCALSLEQRRALPGMQPKRADVICAGALILEVAMQRLRATHCVVSDRGLRWGLVAERIGAGADSP